MPPTIVHVGVETPRRRLLLDSVTALAQGSTALRRIQDVYNEDALVPLLDAADVVIVLNAYNGRTPTGPCRSTFALHRLGFLLRCAPPKAVLVVEDCPSATLTRQLVQPWVHAGRIVITADPVSVALLLASRVVRDVEGVGVPNPDPRLVPARAHGVLPTVVADTSLRMVQWDGNLATARSRPPPPPLVASDSASASASGSASGNGAGAGDGVCLVMIVRDEEAVIQRALKSAWPFVTAYCILDTGSLDATEAKVQEVAALDPRPGVFVHDTWRGFAAARSKVLRLGRELGESLKGTPHSFQWMFMMDADDVLMTPRPQARLHPSLAADLCPCAAMVVRFGPHVVTVRDQVFSCHFPWAYRGVLHEVPILPPPATVQDLQRRLRAQPHTLHRTILPEQDFWLDARTEGFRSRMPDKYGADALVLAREVELHPNDTRALFYLAQSWRDSGRPGRARAVFRRVAAHPEAWSEERYIACLNLVELTAEPAAQGDDPDEKPLDMAARLAVAWVAVGLAPTRRELALSMMALARQEGLWSRQVYALGLLAEVRGSPQCLSTFLFGRVPVYTTGVFYAELAMHAAHFQHPELAERLAATAVAKGLPSQTASSPSVGDPGQPHAT